MALAIVVTFLSVKYLTILINNSIYILVSLVIAGFIGAMIAARIAMIFMPQLVAEFHSLVGLSVVLITVSAFYNQDSFGVGTFGNIKFALLIEISIWVSIGAIIFSGS